MRLARRLLLGTLLLSALAFVCVHVFATSKLRAIDLPPHEPVEVVSLDQSWTPDDWQWFYHASQGGSMELPIPYAWMMALERPEVPFLLFTEVGRLMDSEYLARFGFLPNAETGYAPGGLSEGWQAPEGLTEVVADSLNNPDGLPVGFARTEDWVNERTGEEVDVIGFTCAACHTGQLNYEGRGIRIEGGPAMTDLGKFRTAVGYALGMTLLPGRFGRFADRVLDPGQDADSLKEAIRGFISAGELLQRQTADIYPTEEGFSRLDAIGRIGNFVFAEELNPENFAVSDAPVNFPHIWDTPWLEWVQYNASFSQPMMRNAGESMGVFASVNFDSIDSEEQLFRSTIDVVDLHEMESLIRGPEPYAGLRSPEWPEEILGPLDAERVARGEALYRSTCQGCHLPPLTDAEAFLDDAHWTEPLPDDPHGRRYLEVKLVNLWDIGTDPGAAVNFYQRTVQLGELGEKFKDTLAVGGLDRGGWVTAGVGLPFLIRKATEKRYGDLGLSDSLRAAFDGYRPPVIQAPMAYKARPLNGVWATAPFLHNGAVPTLYHLLGPQEDRPDQFWLGTKEFDPELVGYRLGAVDGGFLLDTSLPGNSNRGHRFCGTREEGPDHWERGCVPPGAAAGARKSTKGIIGPALSHEERLDLLEFLKSLPSAPTPGS